MKRTLTTLTTAALLSAATAAETFTIHPLPGSGDFESPAEALASPFVADGDVLLVLPGTYAGLVLVDKAVTLVAIAGPELTVLDGAGSGPVVEITAGATVGGFTITGGGGFVSVGGVRIDSAATVHLLDCVIAENHPIGDVGIPVGGVLVETGSSADLRGNDIRSNSSLSTGGLIAGPTSTVELIGNKIRGNSGITGGILFGGSGRLVNNQITGNLGSGIGGIFLAGGFGPAPHGAAVELTNCTVYGNLGSAPMGSVGGIFFDDGGEITIRNCLVHSNSGASGADMLLSSDFTAPPAAGVIDLDFSHVGTPAAGIFPGPSMVPPFLPALLVAPITALPGVPTFFGDFRPTSVSPDVDAGESAAFPTDLPARDLHGRLRVIGAGIDIGAFEIGLAKVKKL